MDLKRFFTDEPICDKKVVLTGDEFYHCCKVTRHKVGYKIILCDNGDMDYYATIREINKDSLTAEIYDSKTNDVESKIPLTLYIGNNKDIDDVVQKAVELGVMEIIPFVSQHCNVESIKKERLKKIVLESSKQCGRSRLAKIGDLVSFDEMLASAKNKQCFAFYEFERLNKVMNAPFQAKETALIIGCEGGFSVEEIEKMRQAEISTYTLGKRILRVATAVVSAITLINEKMDELN